MTFLNQLADEILNLVLGACSSSQQASTLFQLYLCGSCALNTRLLRGLSTFEVTGPYRNGRSTPELLAWPSLAADFKSLTTFVLDVRSIDASRKRITSHVQQLPATLTRLELSFSEAHLIPLIETAPVGSMFDDEVDFASNSEMWDLGASFPKLQTMKFVCTDYQSLWVTIDASSLPCLPPYLTELTWNIHFDLEEAEVSLLSRGLTRLELARLNTLTLTSTLLTLLPPQLEYLKGVAFSSEHLVKHVPRTLKEGNYFGWLQPQQLTPTLLSYLPPGTRTIMGRMKIVEAQFGTVPAQWPTLLPPALTELQLDHNLSASEIFRLPRTITRMRDVRIIAYTLAAWLRQDYSEGLPLWPPGLTSLSFSSPGARSAVPIVCLPPTLTEVFGWLPALTEAIDLHESFPRSLHTIKFKEAAYPSEYPYRFVTPMPSSITDVDMGTRSVDPSSFIHFSPSLTYLDLLGTCVHLPESQRLVADLPRSLRELKITIIDVCSLSMLPPNLRSLTTMAFYGAMTREAVLGLPQSLTKLIFTRKITDDELDETALQLLPPSLKQLDLGKMDYSISLLRYIPIGIRRLDARFKILKTEDIDLFLPLRWLRWLGSRRVSSDVRRFVIHKWPQDETPPTFQDVKDQ